MAKAKGPMIRLMPTKLSGSGATEVTIVPEPDGMLHRMLEKVAGEKGDAYCFFLKFPALHACTNCAQAIGLNRLMLGAMPWL